MGLKMQGKTHILLRIDIVIKYIGKEKENRKVCAYKMKCPSYSSPFTACLAFIFFGCE